MRTIGQKRTFNVFPESRHWNCLPSGFRGIGRTHQSRQSLSGATLDSRCPHCSHELAFHYLHRFKRGNAVIAGDSALSCPHCNEAIAHNVYPPEANLPFNLTGEAATYAVVLIAWLIALVLSPFFPVGPTTAVLGFSGLICLVIRQLYVCKVSLASYPLYRSAKIKIIEPWKPHS